MSDTTAPLTKIDSAVGGLSSSPPKEGQIGHRRKSSSAAGVYNINDLGQFIAESALLAQDKKIILQFSPQSRAFVAFVMDRSEG